MRYTAAPVVIVALVCLCLAAPVQAGTTVETDGLRIRIPDGFVSMTDNLPDGGQFEMNMFPGAEIGAEMHVFIRGPLEDYDAMLAVVSLEVTGSFREAFGEEEPSIDALEAELRGKLDEIGNLAQIEQIQRTIIGSGQKALELKMVYSHPMGGDRQMRMAFVMHDHRVVMVQLEGRLSTGGEDYGEWQEVLSGLRLKKPASFGDLAMRYGPFLAGGLLLLLCIVLWKRSGGRDRAVVWLDTPPGASAAAGAMGGLSRATDGLPLYGGAEGMPDDRPAPVPLASLSGAAPRGGPRRIGEGPRLAPQEGEPGRPPGLGPRDAPSPSRPPAPVAGGGFGGPPPPPVGASRPGRPAPRPTGLDLLNDQPPESTAPPPGPVGGGLGFPPRPAAGAPSGAPMGGPPGRPLGAPSARPAGGPMGAPSRPARPARLPDVPPRGGDGQSQPTNVAQRIARTPQPEPRGDDRAEEDREPPAEAPPQDRTGNIKIQRNSDFIG
ncbi:MAG: hypothetical protein ACYTG6_04715 [Planctomycetota bacterium]